jgi:acyl-CoA thioesterase-1
MFSIILCCAPVQARDSILVLGDSLSAAHNMTPELGWVALLDKKLFEMSCPADVVNASISGETTVGGLTRLPRLLADNKPNIVIIELGSNDGLRGFPVSVMRSNLLEMVTLSETAGARVLILGARIPSNYGRRYTESFANTFAQVSEEKGTTLLPFILEGIHDDEKLMQADTIHPNEHAQPILRDTIFKLLQPLSACAKVTP